MEIKTEKQIFEDYLNSAQSATTINFTNDERIIKEIKKTYDYQRYELSIRATEFKWILINTLKIPQLLRWLGRRLEKDKN